MSEETIDELYKRLVATGKFSQQEIEEEIKKHNITSVQQTDAGKDMKNHMNKVNDIFNKHRNKNANQ
jgi:arginine repressor